MLRKPKALVKALFKKSERDLTTEDVEKARQYIHDYWKKLERYHPKDDETLLGLPKPYLVPAFEEGHAFDFNEMYYWDTYFMIQGMLDSTHKDLVIGQLENLLVMRKRFKVIPNASRTYLMGRSQPPFLSSYIFDLYDTYKLSTKWLSEQITEAEAEYNVVWMGTSKPHERCVYAGLSRYYDINYLHDLAEAESGWDMTPRFNRKALHYLPVDLNALLYKYETDFANAARIRGDITAAKNWQKKARIRKNTMNALMWNETKGLYYDYDYKREKRGNISSLASYFPMWAGMVDDSQAAKLVKNLKKFEQKGGLSTTDQPTVPINQIVPGSMPTQWAYPNGWAPLHFVVIKGLEKYGYHEDATRLAQKWLKTNLNWYKRHHVFLEKYNVVDPTKPPAKGVYPSQTGFGWTNSVFERLCQDYIDER